MTSDSDAYAKRQDYRLGPKDGSAGLEEASPYLLVCLFTATSFILPIVMNGWKI